MGYKHFLPLPEATGQLVPPPNGLVMPKSSSRAAVVEMDERCMTDEGVRRLEALGQERRIFGTNRAQGLVGRKQAQSITWSNDKIFPFRSR